ncbi:MAG TPA: LytTR family DNA-binding domain-containing protein [Steroidobacteraceae bacterium]|nr:LytTR family DNA-binding domain-containing protein [Steroidobacteraceae bacterium]
MEIRALIADDEASARSRLRKLLAAHPGIVVEADAHDGVATLEAIRKHRPAVVFLDVQMPGLNGFEVIQALTPEELPLVVFVTAYDEYALAAFEANAVAYLLKPVERSRLQAVVQRLEQIARTPGEASQEQVRTQVVARSRPQPLHHVLALQRDGYLLIPLADVCFFRVEDGVTRVKTATAVYRTHYAIGDLESRLPSPPFFRAHRSVIANLDMVATISPMFKGSLQLTMKDAAGSEIQVSERQAKAVREILQI